MKPTWAFRTRFRREVYGWKGSRLAIERIHEALSEIRAVARHDRVAAADGAVLFLEKLSPALSHVDSSSGALGNAAHAAVQELAELIGKAPVEERLRNKWLERLFEAIQDDDPPYIESLGERWGDLCASAEVASSWADRLLPLQRSVLRERKRGTFAYFPGTAACHSALFKAGRHDELLELLAMDARPIWHDSLWGARVLAARGQVDEAIAYLEDRAGGSAGPVVVARFAEQALLEAGRRAEAFDRYALRANQASSNLSTFRALAKKYPELSPHRLLDHLIASTPEEPGKWFATAKTLKLYDRAVQLAWASPCDPKTLVRAARDHVAERPEVALQVALAALHWISLGHGYEIAGIDVHQAHGLATQAAAATGRSEEVVGLVERSLGDDRPRSAWMRQLLGLPIAKPPR